MRYADMRTDLATIAELRPKKRLGRRQKERLAMASARIMTADVPPATPPRPVTGVDEHGFASGDRQGNVYVAHQRMGGHRMESLRRARRANRFGGYGVAPLRSRIQRQSRKRRTGGVK